MKILYAHEKSVSTSSLKGHIDFNIAHFPSESRDIIIRMRNQRAPSIMHG